MSLGRDPVADRAYLAAVLRAEHQEGVCARRIAERWGIPRETVSRLLDEAKREAVGERPVSRRQRSPSRLLRWLFRALA